MNSLRISGLLLFLLMIGGRVAQAQNPVVWPGDINDNGEVNQFDVLYLGLGSGFTGPSRDTMNAGISWSGKSTTASWPGSFFNGVNHVFGDCDGNGIIDSIDLDAVNQNFQLMHGGFVNPDSLVNGTPLNPSAVLTFPFDTVYGAMTVSVPLLLGSASQIIDSIYGIAFEFTYDTTLVQSVSFASAGSIFSNGPANTPLSFFRDVRNGQRAVGAVVRTDRVNVNGYGSGGSVIIVMEDNLKTGISVYSLRLSLTKLLAITRSGMFVPLNTPPDSVVVLTGSEHAMPSPEVTIGPNPASGLTRVEVTRGRVTQLTVADVTGRIWMEVPEASSRFDLDLSGLPCGLYMVRLQGPDGVCTRRLEVRR